MARHLSGQKGRSVAGSKPSSQEELVSGVWRAQKAGGQGKEESSGDTPCCELTPKSRPLPVRSSGASFPFGRAAAKVGDELVAAAGRLRDVDWRGEQGVPACGGNDRRRDGE